MSNDLISRSELSKGISNKECKIPQFETERELNAFLLGLNAKQIAVMECLSDMAAAYDVDKVVGRLEEKILNSSDTQLGISARMAFGEAIKIVKSGGIE